MGYVLGETVFVAVTETKEQSCNLSILCLKTQRLVDFMITKVFQLLKSLDMERLISTISYAG